MIELTPDQIITKELFEMLRDKKEAIQKTINWHMVEHKKEGHVVVPMDVNELRYPNPSTGAMCKICLRHLGWYCPKSPNYLCYYSDSSSSECCIYCEMPEERK